MAKTSHDLRDSLRDIKNEVIRKYFEFRIQTPHNPYSVLFRPQPYRVLLILSHMRSGSSLLTHILNSNPEIIGYGETHLQYSSEAEFKKLMLNVYCRSQDFKKLTDIANFKMNHKYILDKILHNNKFLNNDFLQSGEVYSIFLIREPKRSLASICELKPDWSAEKSLHYYAGRLPMLETYAQLIGNKERTLVITHEQLLKQTHSVFDSLKKFLGTKQEFSEEYQILKTTGMKNVGDTKGNIKAGRIIRERRSLDDNIEPELVDRGIQAFEQCSATLFKYCTTVAA